MDSMDSTAAHTGGGLTWRDLRSSLRYESRDRLSRCWEKVGRFVAWRVPRSVAMWCFIRVAAHATTGKYSDSVVRDLTVIEALDRWDNE